jgi:hypothetical protein
MALLLLTESADAGSLPALSTLAKSLVSVTSNEISDLPPEIGPLDTPGAEYTISSRTIAILLFLCMLYLLILPKLLLVRSFASKQRFS